MLVAAGGVEPLQDGERGSESGGGNDLLVFVGQQDGVVIAKENMGGAVLPLKIKVAGEFIVE